MTHLTFVRHGETDWNAQRRVQGSTDIPLNEVGREQARLAADALSATIDCDVETIVVASDLSRASETAQIIAAALGLHEPLQYAGLRERGYGDAEGVLVSEFPSRFGSWQRHEIPGAETTAALRSRVLDEVERIVADARRAHAPRAPHVIAVSHGGVINELIRFASGETLPLPGERLTNASIHRFQADPEGLRLVSYSATTA